VVPLGLLWFKISNKYISL